MTEEHRPEAFRLLHMFLKDGGYYLDSVMAYGDGGEDALNKALDLFLSRPELGFVWIGMDGNEGVGVCVISFAISTSAGSLVAKMDDVFVAPARQGQGFGSSHLAALVRELKAAGIARIDTSVHHENPGANRFYKRNGFMPLNEERLALLL